MNSCNGFAIDDSTVNIILVIIIIITTTPGMGSRIRPGSIISGLTTDTVIWPSVVRGSIVAFVVFFCFLVLLWTSKLIFLNDYSLICGCFCLHCCKIHAMCDCSSNSGKSFVLMLFIYVITVSYLIHFYLPVVVISYNLCYNNSVI